MSAATLIFVVSFVAMHGAKGEVSTLWMKQTLTQHFAKARHHVTNPDYKTKAKEFIIKEFDDMGLTVKTHMFDTDLEDVTGVNVIGILKGKHYGTNQDNIVAIGAHYDTMRNTPGVNDNGAAVVTLLQAAREVSSHTGRNSTVLFIAFDFEEWETSDDAACSEISCGSRLLVIDWLPYFFDNWSPDQWKGIVVMDTILNFDNTNDTQTLPDGLNRIFPKVVASVQSDGKQGDFLAVVGRSKGSAALSVFNSSWNRLEEVQYEMEMLKVPDHVPMSYLSDLTRSDHVAFWHENLDAIFLTDTANLRGYMKECYHKACDDDTHITDKRMQFAAKISRALISWVDTMAPYPETTATTSLPVMPGTKGEVSTSWMTQTLIQHFAKARHHVTDPDYKSEAKEFIIKEFYDMGLTVKTHMFDTDLEDVEGANVIGILKGKHFGTNQDNIVAIGAHYDTMRNTPGVNDNGAAVVTLLQAAREVSSHTGRNSTVLFIAFDFEEWETGSCIENSCGSRQLVTDWLHIELKNWSPDQWKGIVVMDTILNFDDTNDTQTLPDGLDLVFPKVVASVQSDGKQGDFLAVVGRSNDSAALSVFNNSWNRLEEVDYEMEMLKIPDHVPMSNLPDLTRSDHVAFWHENLGAIFLTDTANLRGYMKECYHNKCDDDTHITDKKMQFAAKIARALISWVDTMAPYPKTTGTAAHPTLDGLTTAVVIACVVILMPRHLLRHL